MLTRFFTVLRGRTAPAVLLVSIVAAGACSDDGDESSNTGGFPSATGGSQAQGGSTGGTSLGGRGATGGSATGGATGGVASPSGGSADPGGRSGTSSGGAGMKGGASSMGGRGPDIDPGEPCTEDCPAGTVQTCFDDCPLGSCDNGGFFGDVPCSMLYPGEINEDTVYCRAGQTSNYCFTTIDRILKYYEISCDDGSPTVTLCDGGCGVDSDGVAACN